MYIEERVQALEMQIELLQKQLRACRVQEKNSFLRRRKQRS